MDREYSDGFPSEMSRATCLRSKRTYSSTGMPVSACSAPALGTLLRHPAAVVLVLPEIASTLPARIESNVEEYWPTMAGAQVTAVIHSTHHLGPWPGFGLMCLSIAAARPLREGARSAMIVDYWAIEERCDG
jgi:hypothetical protein